MILGEGSCAVGVVEKVRRVLLEGVDAVALRGRTEGVLARRMLRDGEMRD